MRIESALARLLSNLPWRREMTAPFLEPESSFLAAMRSADLGMHAESLEADGKLHRYRVAGDKRGTLNGWYIYYPESPASGVFGCWRRDRSCTWCSVEYSALIDVDRQAFAARLSAARSARDKTLAAELSAAAARALKIWKMSSPVEAHPYLFAKAVRSLGIRQFGGKLVIPLFDAAGTIWSLQFINQGGNKRFLKGGRKHGNYFPIGLPGETIVVCEDYAAAANVYMSTRTATVVAFDAGNLKPVAKVLKKKFPAIKIVFAADIDIATPDNPGLTHALDPACAVGGKVACPTFEETDCGRHEDRI